jgi:hypothetical protein
MRQRFEHKVKVVSAPVGTSGYEVQEVLKDLELLGWELVAASHASGYEKLYFKRPFVEKDD